MEKPLFEKIYPNGHKVKKEKIGCLYLKWFFRYFSGQLYRYGLQIRLDRGAAPPPSPSHKPSTTGRRADVRATAEGLSGTISKISKIPEIRVCSQ